MRRIFLAIAALIPLALAPVAASAITFAGSFSISGGALSDPGLAVNVNPSNGVFNLDLAPGEMKQVQLFNIWTDETWVNSDDMVPQSLEVAFNLNGGGNGVAHGAAVGGSFLYGLIQWGQAAWNGPVQLAPGPGHAGILSVMLYNTYFNPGFLGLAAGEHHGGEVYAKFSYDVAPIPLPAALPLLLTALGGLVVMRSRRRA